MKDLESSYEIYVAFSYILLTEPPCCAVNEVHETVSLKMKNSF